MIFKVVFLIVLPLFQSLNWTYLNPLVFTSLFFSSLTHPTEWEGVSEWLSGAAQLPAGVKPRHILSAVQCEEPCNEKMEQPAEGNEGQFLEKLHKTVSKWSKM